MIRPFFIFYLQYQSIITALVVYNFTTDALSPPCLLLKNGEGLTYYVTPIN